MLDLSKQYRLNTDIVLKKINDKHWALSTKTGNQYKLNELSYFILNELTESRTVDELTAFVISIYNISAQNFSQDCIELIEGAVNTGLVEEVNL
jgi:hypothetical protein